MTIFQNSTLIFTTRPQKYIYEGKIACHIYKRVFINRNVTKCEKIFMEKCHPF